MKLIKKKVIKKKCLFGTNKYEALPTIEIPLIILKRKGIILSRTKLVS